MLIPTARAGIDIVGLDASPSMLAVCRANLAAEPPAVRARVNLALGDMRAFDLGQSFTLVTLPFRPFQHLVTVGDQLACLASVRRSLLPGGRVILDLFNPSLERADAAGGRGVSSGIRVHDARWAPRGPTFLHHLT